MSRLPIRWRFTLWFGATLAIALIAFSLLLLLVMRRQLLAAVDSELAEELREVTTELALPKEPAEILAHLAPRFAVHGEFQFEVRRPAGEIVFRSAALEGHPPLDLGTSPEPGNQQFESREVSGVGESRVATALADGPGGPYIARAIMSLEPFERQMSILATVVAAFVPVAIGLALLGGYLLARRVLSPVDRMVEVAKHITASDLRQRVEVVNADDELGRLAQTINSLFDRLEKSIDEMRRFTADAAHELRTPLAVLRSGIEVALRVPRSPEEYRQALEAAADEASRLTRLADQLLFLSRQEAGMVQIEREEVRLDALLKDVAERLEAPAKESGLTLLVEPLTPCAVRGDDVRLGQVFFNAIDNAIKYTPRGGRVVIRTRPTGARVRVEIEDTGIGISPEHLSGVFNRFYRADSSPNGDRQGAGLGLAIAKSIVAAHDGEIWLESQIGRGTVLRVELPLMESTLPSDEENSRRGASSGTSL
jgi:heavy metal sensor kinase